METRRPHVVFWADSLVVGGAERVVQALAEDLPGEGFDVTVGCFRSLGPVGEELGSAGVRVVGDLAPRRVDPSQVLRLRQFLRDTRADVAHLLDHSNVLLYGRLACALAGVPQVCAVHRTRRADGSPSLGTVDRLLMPLSRRVIAVSRGHARYLVEHENLDAARLEVVYNGVDPDAFTPGDELQRRLVREELGLAHDAPVAAVVAALRPEKNHEGLLDALVRVEDLHLLVIGSGSLEAQLKSQCLRLGLGERVHWLGRRNDVAHCLRAADFLVLPSHPAVETFPLSVLEAMAAGLPVVTTRVGSLDEMVTDGEEGRLVPPGDEDALVVALAELAADPDLRRAMGRRARNRVETAFTRRNMVRGHADVLRHVIEES